MPPELERSQAAEQVTQSRREPLAVIGIGCRLPGGIDSPESFWQALLSGLNAIRDVPEDRWKHSRFHDTNPEKSGCIRNAKGGFIDGVDQFDGEFFGYFPAEAQRIDPQQRLLLEVTHEAMEDAGLRRDQLDGTRTSVFVGSFMYDFLGIQAASEQRDEINPYVAMGCAVSPLANRISYDFNLKGPSVSLDTACSSSLVALHLACRSLWDRQADLAIAGGVNVMLRPESSIMLSKAGFLNPDQFCKAFDASANGYVRGEGVGVVILKPLRKALADGDAIYAWVLGSAVNQDGYLPEGFTVPNVFSQISLLEEAYAEAGVNPLLVDYVEAHGTGTPVGDPIESLALGAVLGRDRDEGQRCLIGSVKTNIGHLEGAAGIAGFIKGVLAAHHGVAPPNLHFNIPNPEIDWENLKLEVPTQPTLLESTDHPRYVGVNSFGAGGTNAHIVLQEPTALRAVPQVRAQMPWDPQGCESVLYVIRAAHRDALRPLAQRHAEFLRHSSQALEDIAFSAFTRRSHYPHLLAVVGRTAAEIAERLQRFAEGQVDSSNLTTTIGRKKEPKLAFVFSGQGGQWVQMGLQLMRHEPVFRQWMEELDELFAKRAGWSLLAEFRAGEETSRINETVVVQPAVMAVQIALVKLYERYGVRPQGIVGHSIGEVAAAYAAGALTLEQAVEVIYHRSQAQNQAAGQGGMLAVGLPLEEARKLIDVYGGRVSIGAVNGPQMLTLSGDSEPLRQIAELLEARGIFNRPVKVQVAYHSHHIEPLKELMLETLADVAGTKSKVPLYSTVTGQCESGSHLTADYWYQNARQPVLFTHALNAMLEDGYDTFIEIGPHPVLVGGAESLIQKLDADAVIFPAMTRREPEPVVFLQSLARLAARGVEPDLRVLFGEGRKYVRLPRYPWQHSRYWFEAPAVAEVRRGRYDHPFLERQTQLVTEEGLAVWEASLDLQKFPYLRDHQVDGEVVFPATGHLELAWAVATEQFRHESFFLERLQFDLPLILPDNSRHPLDVRLEIVSAEGDYRICSRPADAAPDAPWTRHSSGCINTVHDRFEKSTVTLESLRREFSETDEMAIEKFYETIAGAGLPYGESFQCVTKLWCQGHNLLARLHLHEDLVLESQRHFFHPALLDACLHVVFGAVHLYGDPNRIFLPHRLHRVRFYSRPGVNLWCHLNVLRNDDQYLTSDTLIFDENGDLIAEVQGLVCKRLVGAGSQPTDRVYDGCYEYQWESMSIQEELHSKIFDLANAILISDNTGLSERLSGRLSAAGIRTLCIPAETCGSFDEHFNGVPLDRRTTIVFAAGLSASDRYWTALADCPFVSLFLNLVQTLHHRAGVPRLCVVTNGASRLDGDAAPDLSQAILHGMARVVRNECPNIPLTVIDVDRSLESIDIEALIHELLFVRRDRDESEVALRSSGRYVRRLVPVDRESAERRAISLEAGCGGSFRADIGDPGMLDKIVFRRILPLDPGADEVEIAVEAAGMNFKDLMNAMGLLPENAVAGGMAGARLGLEVAGVVRRLGKSVTGFEVGDSVLARVSDGFSGRVICPAHCVVHRPGNVTPQQAAAVPAVYITAWYSLCHLARMEAGETVLIHSAAGGVGGAAIQLAKLAGVRVIATAGTKEKRDMLKRQGVEHVFDSRSLDFFNHVMVATEGRGVDIVLNSLTGRFITQSLKCLAPYGRFIELGKADIYRNSKLGLEKLGENISFFVVDVDRLAAQKPKLHRHVLEEVVALMKQGRWAPPEITEFPVSRLSEALKYMARAAYHGKIILKMTGDSVQALPPRQISFRPDRSYLVTGGASGLGLQIARWMASRGARHLVLASRSGCKDDADETVVMAIRNLGARVQLPRVDIADSIAVNQLIQRIDEEGPTLAGVIHGAALLDDATIPAIDMTRFERVFHAKAQGAWNLHQSTAGSELDFFLMLSSISSIFGIHGQINYAAANFFQDTLAEYRRQQGLTATSVNLGLLGDYAGMSKRQNDERDVVGLLESQGMLVMRLDDVLAKLEAALIQQPSQRMMASIDWSRFRSAYPHLGRDARFLDLMSDTALARGGRSRESGLRSALAELEHDDRSRRLEEELTACLARILDADPGRIEATASIDVFGLDSLMLTELQVWIARMLDINLPLIKLLKGPSVKSLAAELMTQLEIRSSAKGDRSGSTEELGRKFTVIDLEGIELLGPWLVRGRGDRNSPVRLLCFHSMGVGASLFTSFLLNPPECCDILAIQTPGRENRDAEPVLQSVDQLVDHLVPHLLPLLDRPVIVWGHSYGGIVANEVLRRLRDNHDWQPSHFVVTGTVAPHLIHLWQKREVMLKAMVADNSPEYLISLSRYVDDAEFLKSIIPLMRRDWPLMKNYRFRPAVPLKTPITAFAARQDDMVYADEILGWSELTTGGFELIEVDGDHWFLNRNRELLIKTLSEIAVQVQRCDLRPTDLVGVCGQNL